ncbi:MAG: hypothetical protein ACM3X6_01180 [Patescibacteria group bacterium]
MIAEIAANIEVLAQFGRGGLRPRLFVWERRRHTISRVTAAWSEREGAHQRHYFAVQTDGANLYELCFCTRSLTWSLVRIHSEG